MIELESIETSKGKLNGKRKKDIENLLHELHEDSEDLNENHLSRPTPENLKSIEIIGSRNHSRYKSVAENPVSIFIITLLFANSRSKLYYIESLNRNYEQES